MNGLAVDAPPAIAYRSTPSEARGGWECAYQSEEEVESALSRVAQTARASRELCNGQKRVAAQRMRR